MEQMVQAWRFGNGHGYGTAGQDNNGQIIAQPRNRATGLFTSGFQKVQFIGLSFSHLDKWSVYFRCLINNGTPYHRRPSHLLSTFLLSQCKMTRQSISSTVT